MKSNFVSLSQKENKNVKLNFIFSNKTLLWLVRIKSALHRNYDFCCISSEQNHISLDPKCFD